MMNKRAVSSAIVTEYIIKDKKMAPTKRRIRKVLQDRGGWVEQFEYLFLFIALFVCLSLLLWNISTLIARGYREKRKFDIVQEDIAAQEAENEKLQEELAYARSDVAAEGGARNVLGMAYEGEEIVFVDEEALSSEDEADDEATVDGAKEEPALGSKVDEWIKLFF